MYAYISGTLVDKRPTEAVIDVHGVGYRLHIPTSTFERLPAPEKTVKLFTYHHVREDANLLYGFLSMPEKRVFEVMLAVSGIGPKLALAALSAMTPADLRAHVLHGETAILTSIPGVGKKTAERLIIELRDRFADMEPLEDGLPASAGPSAVRGKSRSDALAALESLGFARAAAEKHLQKAMKSNPDVESAEDLIRLVLRESGE